ncbi:MAG TPA: hypothetical protein VND54_09550 [Candidatus Saccharimonadales bacterium]|nr:hypothetical protein [Candidatus Saccharimonadales bacterium]
MPDPTSLPALAPIATVVVLLEVAAGTTLAAYAVDLVGKVGRGFVGTTSLICAGLMALDLLIEALLPSGTTLLGAPLPAGAQASLFHWSIAFTVALLGYAFFCSVMTDVARRVVGAIAIGFGAMAIAKAAAAFGPSLGGVGTAAVAFVPAALVSGSALAGMLLGHWYLVAPNLSFRPLRRAIDIVFIAVALQAAVIVLVILTSGSTVRGELLWSGDAVPFWLLVVGSGIVFTTGVALLTRHFARIRANQPATAMLYVLIISVVMGVVPAHLLFFVTGAPI